MPSGGFKSKLSPAIRVAEIHDSPTLRNNHRPQKILEKFVLSECILRHFETEIREHI